VTGAIAVELVPHDPAWAAAAEAEGEALKAALGPCLRRVHHIGSTAIPGIRAKPILDLIPVVTSLEALVARRTAVKAMGYDWRGEFGLKGRRYCTRSDPETGRRLSQLHCYAEGSPEIARHLAFRDFLRAHPAVAADYEGEKLRCRALHPGASHGYSDCKHGWIAPVEAEALAWAARKAAVSRPPPSADAAQPGR
jgi:GrpB-like predicted nucleotidyltransferase (UPF0157 family)